MGDSTPLFSVSDLLGDVMVGAGETHVVSQDEPAGNTETAGRAPAAPKYQAYRYAFTLRLEEEMSQLSQVRRLWRVLDEHSKEFVFQIERGENTDYIHFQGCFSLIVKHRLIECKNLLGFNSIHLEYARDWYASKNYCSKLDTRVSGPWTKKTPPLEPKINGDLFPWQQELVQLIETEPDDRTIHVFTDTVGNRGKSAIGIHLSDTREDVLYLPSGKFEGVKQHVVEVLGGRGIRAVIFNIPRTQEDHIPFALIEEIKDGYILNTKYGAKRARFDPPHVIVFVNDETINWEQHFSADRIVKHTI